MKDTYFDQNRLMDETDLQRSADIPEQIERVRRELPRRTREAEAERRTMLASEAETQHDTTKRVAAEHNLGRNLG